MMLTKQIRPEDEMTDKPNTRDDAFLEESK